MAEYIEREAILREIERRERLMVVDKTISVDALKRFILNRPAADVAPVRHGQWIIDSAGGKIACSDCGCIYLGYNGRLTPNYCPNCGAKMDGGDGDEAD